VNTEFFLMAVSVRLIGTWIVQPGDPEARRDRIAVQIITHMLRLCHVLNVVDDVSQIRK
jgi:hypothetical protein